MTQALLLMACSTTSPSVSTAYIENLARQIPRGSFTTHIHIVDINGKPIPADTLWIVELNEKKGYDQDMLKRMVRRYADDADFVQFADGLGHFSVLRTDLKGEYVDTKSCKCDDRSRTTVYAAIKRGYSPKIVSVTVEKDSSSEVKIALEKDPDAKIDPRMLELDLLRAGSHSVGESGDKIMQSNRLQADREANLRIRNLAQQLEQENKLDLASAVYYNLAFLPSVDTVTLADGQEKIVGYTNGYSDRNPQREADIRKSIELNQSTPHFLFVKYRKKYFHADRTPLTVSERKSLLDGVEKFIDKYGEKMFPIDSFLSSSYLQIGDFKMACFSIKRSKEFERTQLSDDDHFGSWGYELKQINQAATKAGYEGASCKF